MNNKIYNTKYSYFYKELKRLQNKKYKAEIKENDFLVEKYTKEMTKIIEKMKRNCDIFLQIPEDVIEIVSPDKKSYNKIMEEKRRYQESKETLETLLNDDIITDNEIESLKPYKKPNIFKKVMLGVSVVGVVALAAFGITKLSKNDQQKGNNKKTEQQNTTTEENKEQENVTTEKDDRMEVEYTEKKGVTVKFKKGATNSNTTQQSENSKSNNQTSGNNNPTPTPSNGNNKSNDKDKNNKDDKKDKKDKTDKDTPTPNPKPGEGDNTNSDPTPNPKPGEGDNTNSDPTPNPNPTPGDGENKDPDLDLDNKEEINDNKVIENNLPAVPGDMIIEETPGDPTNDETHYYIESTPDVGKEENKTEIIVDSKDLPIYVDEEGIIYYDSEGNEISKEQWDKIHNDLVNIPNITFTEPSKSELQQLKSSLKTLKGQSEEIVSISGKSLILK